MNCYRLTNGRFYIRVPSKGILLRPRMDPNSYMALPFQFEVIKHDIEAEISTDDLTAALGTNQYMSLFSPKELLE